MRKFSAALFTSVLLTDGMTEVLNKLRTFEHMCKSKSCYLLLEVHYYSDFISSYLPNEICISLQK